jgi:V8-like Glu-specific endopeptidase
VCKITDINGEGWGTGFLIEGTVISDELAGEVLIATNAHVVSSTPGVAALQPIETEARFDVLGGGGEDRLRLNDLSELWTSPPTRCDVTLLKFEGERPDVPEPITGAPALPLANEGAFVYVVGHPAGAGLKLSIRGNDLLAYDEQQVKVHYRAPTEPGSSGSPVFTPQWQLMAVHHAGSSKMRRLDDPNETYEANEGLTLEFIRQEFGQG